MIILLFASLVYGNLWVIKLPRDVTPRSFAQRHGFAWEGNVSHLDGYYTFRETNGKKRNAADFNVEYAGLQMARKRHLRASASDPLFTDQWHLAGPPGPGINAPAAWDNYKGNSIIAIVDDGLQNAHPDLSSQFEKSLSWNFNDNNANVSPSSIDAHGTACAGVCCAKANNSHCGAGVCPDCRVAGLKLIAEPVDDLTEASALSFKPNDMVTMSGL